MALIIQYRAILPEGAGETAVPSRSLVENSLLNSDIFEPLDVARALKNAPNSCKVSDVLKRAIAKMPPYSKKILSEDI
jgi:hypothetical protein